MEQLQQENDFDSYAKLSTGEIVEGIFISKDEYEQELRRQESKIAIAKYLRSKNSFCEYIKSNYGAFYFNNYMKLLDKLNNDYALAFRFLYLCTYADYGGYLRFGSNDSYMNDKDFEEVFSMSRTMTIKLKNELFNSGLIYKNEENIILINSTFYTRGKLSKNDKEFSSRVFDNGIRELYKKSKPKEHKKLGVIIPLLKYVNVYLNVLCKNPYEKDTKHIKLLSINDICDIVGYDYSNASRLKKTLTNVTVNGYPMVGFFNVSSVKSYIINPYIFYKGNSIKDLHGIEELFKLQI